MSDKKILLSLFLIGLILEVIGVLFNYIIAWITGNYLICFAIVLLIIDRIRTPKKPEKLCKHDWEYIDKDEVTYDTGCMVDIDTLYIYQCKHCLTVKKSYWLL